MAKARTTKRKGTKRKPVEEELVEEQVGQPEPTENADPVAVVEDDLPVEEEEEIGPGKTPAPAVALEVTEEEEAEATDEESTHAKYERIKKGNFVPGACWSEEEAGTNGCGQKFPESFFRYVE